MLRIREALTRLVAGRALLPAHLPSEAKASRAGPLLRLQTLGQPVWAPRDYSTFAREGYAQNAIVHRCVRMVAEAAASVPLLLYERDAEIEDHPLIDVLRRPSPGMTGTDLLEQWYGFLLVSGNAYMEAVALDGEIRELHALRPDRMNVVPGPDGWPEAWEYEVAGRSVRFAGEVADGVAPILHLKLFHPGNDYYGLSPIEAAATAIDIHNEAARWNKALLDNSARPSGALVYAAANGQMTGEQFERLKGELEATYQGARHAGRPLLLEGGLDWKPLSLSPKDMDFIEAKNAAAREIALALGVPPMLLGIPGDNTYSNYQEASRAFWRQTVLPLVSRTARALSGWLGGGVLELRADLDQVEALSPEREALWTRLEKAGFLTRAEKRAAAGYGQAERQVEGKYSPEQPRVPRGKPGGGQWTAEDEDEVLLGDAGDDDLLQLVNDGGGYPVNILDEKALGGHTVERHVSKPEEYLKARILNNRVNIPLIGTVGEKRAGSFSSLEAANKFVNSTLSQADNAERLEAFVRGDLLYRLPTMYLHSDFERPTGYEAYSRNDRSQPEIRSTFGVTVQVRRTDRADKGYFVERAWPTNRD